MLSACIAGLGLTNSGSSEGQWQQEADSAQPGEHASLVFEYMHCWVGFDSKTMKLEHKRLQGEAPVMLSALLCQGCARPATRSPLKGP